MKNSKFVTATADGKGQVFFPNPNPGKDGNIYGYIRLESTEIDLENPVARPIVKSMLKQFSAEAAKHVSAGDTFVGQLINKDTLEPQYEGHEPLEVPVRDEKGEIIMDGDAPRMRGITSGGRPVYRTTNFTKDFTVTDTKLDYDKVAVAANATKLS